MADRNNLFPRSSGILLHPTSLPGPYGIGDLGRWAYRFVDCLADAKQSVWQVLPLGPTGFGGSPYQVYSSFAGNTALISLDALVDQGWLDESDVASHPWFSPHKVDYDRAIAYHEDLLTLAYDRFVIQDDRAQKSAFRAWAEDPRRWWLDDYALFMVLKEHYGGRPWTEWPPGEALRDPTALEEARAMHACRLDEIRWRQWVFATQWDALRSYANGKGIRIVGDIPIYVAQDSSDVWTRPDLFELDETGAPTAVAGVPPDYFSATGQIWESPLYAWEAHHADGFAWWTRRMARAAAMFDAVRIDHFLGLHRGWRVPVGAETAEHGAWVLAPGRELLGAIVHAMPQLKIVAEDLGVVTSEAAALRDHFNLPGMRIIQFAFDEPDSIHLPANYDENCIAYSGTHDNNTTRGWVESEAREEQSEPLMRACELLDASAEELPLRLIDAVMRSPAHTAIIPMQDALLLGEEARMNTPGVAEGNWRWRLAGGDMNAAWERLQIWASTSGRVSGSR